MDMQSNRHVSNGLGNYNIKNKNRSRYVSYVAVFLRLYDTHFIHRGGYVRVVAATV